MMKYQQEALFLKKKKKTKKNDEKYQNNLESTVKNPSITDFANIQVQYANFDELYLDEIKDTMHHFIKEDELEKMNRKAPEILYANLSDVS